MAAVAPFVPIISGVLGLASTFLAPKPKIPKAQIPAPPAPTRRQDTGAQVSLGSPDARVSGNSSTSPVRRDVLGSMGLGGLNF